MANGPEWRTDPLTDRRVIIAPARADRPHTRAEGCPFCVGCESETPDELLAFRDPGSKPNQKGWSVRVVPNRFAAVQIDPMVPEGAEPASGTAEVFIECPEHIASFRHLSPEQATHAIRAWRDRLRYWWLDGRFGFAQVFKNEGPGAGASVEHCHSQLIAIPKVPPLVMRELAKTDLSDCPYCEWIVRERAGPRFVLERDGFVAICPPAPRVAGETWLIPSQHFRRFEELTDDSLPKLAGIVLELLRRLAVFGDPDFNIIVKSSPFAFQGNYHWRFELLPRTGTWAGWEWSTGLLINTMLPEVAAVKLREQNHR